MIPSQNQENAHSVLDQPSQSLLPHDYPLWRIGYTKQYVKNVEQFRSRSNITGNVLVLFYE